MKRLFIMTTIAATLLAARFLSAQPIHPPQVAPMLASETVILRCSIYGVVYPVDQSFNVWAVNSYGYWFISGQLVLTGNGYVVVRNDGATFAASCY